MWLQRSKTERDFRQIPHVRLLRDPDASHRPAPPGGPMPDPTGNRVLSGTAADLIRLAQLVALAVQHGATSDSLDSDGRPFPGFNRRFHVSAGRWSRLVQALDPTLANEVDP